MKAKAQVVGVSLIWLLAFGGVLFRRSVSTGDEVGAGSIGDDD